MALRYGTSAAALAILLVLVASEVHCQDKVKLRSVVEDPSGEIFAEETATMLVEDGAREGPAWNPTLGLLISGHGGVNRYINGQIKPYDHSTATNGLLFDGKGRLLRCETKLRRVTRMEPNGETTVLSEGFNGMKFNNTNDITEDSHGRIYFSDPRYGSRDGMEMIDAEGNKVEGVYRIDPDGKTHQIIKHEVDRPNGVLVTLRDRYLLVAGNNNNTNESDERKLFRFDLNEDGTIDPDSKKTIYDWKRGRGPDGMTQDVEGRIYVAGGLTKPKPPHETVDKSNRGGVYVFDIEGEFVAFISIPRDECTNCAFGDEDHKTLYITAGGSLWKIRTNSAGFVCRD